jgi:hypothetical protein
LNVLHGGSQIFGRTRKNVRPFDGSHARKIHRRGTFADIFVGLASTLRCEIA